METRVLTVQDLEWSFWPGGRPCALVAPGMCPARRRAGAGHRCLGKFLPAGFRDRQALAVSATLHGVWFHKRLSFWVLAAAPSLAL